MPPPIDNKVQNIGILHRCHICSLCRAELVAHYELITDHPPPRGRHTNTSSESGTIDQTWHQTPFPTEVGRTSPRPLKISRSASAL